MSNCFVVVVQTSVFIMTIMFWRSDCGLARDSTESCKLLESVDLSTR